MALSIHNYRIDSDRLIGSYRLTVGQDESGREAVKKDDLSFGKRISLWWNNSGSFRHGSDADIAANKTFKQSFYSALCNAEGVDVARAATRKAGLPEDWKSSPAEMTAKTVRKVLDEAQKIRVKALKNSVENCRLFCTDTGPQSLAGVLYAANQAAGRPDEAVSHELMEIFTQEMRDHPDYGRRAMVDSDFDGIGQRAIQTLHARQQHRFQTAYPALEQFLARGHANVNVQMREKNAVFEQLNVFATSLPPGFSSSAQEAMQSIRNNSDVLKKMAYEPDSIEKLRAEMRTAYNTLAAHENAIASFVGQLDQAGQDLQSSLVMELRHQQGLIASKVTLLDEVLENDPLSKKAVAYSDKLWAEAANHLFNEAIDFAVDNPDRVQPDTVQKLRYARDTHFGERTAAYNNAVTGQRTIDPATLGKSYDKHPAIQAKKATQKWLKDNMREAGLPRSVVKELTASNKMSQARRAVLNANTDWAPYRRNMIVSRDGVTRAYQSAITPGAFISARFARRYASTVPLDGASAPHPSRNGVSSAEKADHYHARNLKVSELFRLDDQNQIEMDANGQPKAMAKVIGHGVLDMWEIENSAERFAANERGAKEVLEAALTTNPRVLQTAINGQPVTLTHVSVNLTTPSEVREYPILRGAIPDYQELTFTQEQFRVFGTYKANQPAQFTVADPAGGPTAPEQNVLVNVDPITFSFGINHLATSKLGGWKNVAERNKEAIVKFIGDPGSGRDGDRGLPIGGFIGSIIDRLNGIGGVNPAAKTLANKMRQQANQVRLLYTAAVYKNDNGDPAKMGREILALQALAENALDLMGDAGQAATMSKGCKSDKDRGGVTDVELKHKLITEDMGGEIWADSPWTEEDHENYYVVGVASGQLENQRLNTGFAGSKEAAKLQHHVHKADVRQYLAGLGALASE
ncbi:inositol phosphate phosphatase SopB [Hyphomicrobium sp. MC1]|uniref:inositol phosphate phosphatase SopB n=1 Tax=Hyphomicrobium sp. (strain MC1) TaxID=717785 RepID=UPI000213EDA8|nr:inositol phosphate phosphatase SopB [Hyphomicrobium sp. MC1]CCB66664.1 protein of unknown function [Hyphomicrobium sp. MC1]